MLFCSCAGPMTSCLRVTSHVTPLLFALPLKAFEVFKAPRFVFLSKLYSQRGARAHDPAIRHGVLYQPNQPGAPGLRVSKGMHSELGRWEILSLFKIFSGPRM